MVAGVLQLACDGAPATFERMPDAVFQGALRPPVGRVFDVLAADMDADGDPDVLVNWHHLRSIELFENDGGRLRLVEPEEAGLDDAPGVPRLFAPAPAMVARLEELDSRGLHVWHDLDRRGSWRLAWRDGGDRLGGLVLELSTPLAVVDVRGLEDREVERVSPSEVRVVLEAGTGERSFAVKTEQVTTALRLRARSGSGEDVPVRAGRELRSQPAGVVELWKPDPHGIAWVDVEGDPRPEAYVTRGGLMGELERSGWAKRDRFFVPAPDGGTRYVLVADRVPSGHGRGRRVEWVDADADGRVELSVSNKGTPNELLRLDRDGGLRDVAAATGLDLEGGEVQCWGDHDGDGLQDLYYLDRDRVHVLRNLGGRRFEHVPAASIGLMLPVAAADPEGLFDFCALRLADFDADGDLDLWALMVGDRRTNHLFERRGAGFVDVTARVGLDRIEGNIFVTLMDVDADGFEDAVSSGRLAHEGRVPLPPGAGHLVLWHNDGGRRFRLHRLPAGIAPLPIHAAAAADVDGDGRRDLVCIGTGRDVLRNVATPSARVLEVVPRDRTGVPIGAVVRARYADGRVVARRYGSADSSAYGQSLGALRFGAAEGATIEEVSVQWPGEAGEQVVPLRDAASPVVVERRR